MAASDPDQPASPEALAAALATTGYLPDPGISLSLFLALRLGRPLMVEGPAGVGKTELGRATALALGRELIRLQCYEGLDEPKALYEWDYGKQMLYTQLCRDSLARATEGASTIAEAVEIVARSEGSFFDRRFLMARPLLAALQSAAPVVLLIDEVDRADPEFEALLLEILESMQITIPELGTVKAAHPPLVVLTTNATREMTEALRRRCLHAFIDYPPPERELLILEARVPGIDRELAARLTSFVARLRTMDLRKVPSISETIDWARALIVLGRSQLDRELVEDTLGVLLKHHEDREAVGARAEDLTQGLT